MSEEMSMDSILDSSLEDFADLPEWVIPPAGTYNVTLVGLGSKAINDKPVLELKLIINSVEELSDPSATPPADGSEVSQAFFMSSEFGQGAFKKVTANLREATGVNTTRELMEAVKGMECILISKTRKDKNDPDKVYFQIVDLFPV